MNRIRVTCGLTFAALLAAAAASAQDVAARRRVAQRDIRSDLGQTLHQINVDRAGIEAEVQSKIANWRDLVAGSVADGRQLLRAVLEAPLRFTPDGKNYRFTAPVATGKVIAGAVLPTKMASPPGYPILYLEAPVAA